jgi:hypothetical protein
VNKTEFQARPEACSRCYFCDTVTLPEQNVTFSICRLQSRGSAAIVPTPGPGGKAVPQWVYTTYWDQVGPNDWCSHFKPAETH